MADIAQIGFATNTAALSQTEKELRKLPPAAKAADEALSGAAGALDAVSAASQGVTAKTPAATRVIDAAAGVSTKATGANDNLAKSIQRVINASTGVKSGGTPMGRADDIIAYGAALDDLRAKYDPLFAAGRTYKATLTDINNALKVGALNEKQHAAAIMDAKVAFVQQVNSIRGTDEQFKSFNGTADKTRKAYQGLSFDAKNLSYQLVDVTQGILTGQPVYQVFFQQIGQIGQIAATTKGGIKALFVEILGGIRSVLTPMVLLVTSVVALGAGLAILALNTLSNAKAMDELSKQTDIAVTRLRALQQATAIKGISIDDFSAGMKSFSDAVFNAKNNVGELRGLMVANGLTAKTEADYFGKVADLVARTKSGIQQRNILEAAGLPTTQKWVDFMSQGQRGIDAVTSATVTFNDAAEKNLVRKAKQFDEAWNLATTNVSNYFKSVTVDGINFFDKLQPYIDKIRKFNETRFNPPPGSATRAAMDQGSTFADRFGGDGKNPAANNTALATGLNKAANGILGADKPDPKTAQQLLVENQQMQQRISILGDLATVNDQVKQKQLELNAASLQGVGVSDAMAAKIINNTRAQAEMNKVMQQATVGVYNEAAARKAATDTLQSWIDKGLVNKNNTQEMAAAQQVLARNLQQTAEAAQVAAAAFPQLKQAELDAGNGAKLLDQTLTTSFSNMVSPIQDVLNGVTSIGQGFKNLAVIALKAIQEMIIKMLILKPLMSLFDGGSGIGGFFANLFKPNAKGNVYANDNLKPFARGGTFTNQVVNKPTMFAYGAGMGLMGEAGPEAIMPLTRGADGSLGVQMYGQQSRDSGQNYAFNDHSTYVIGGNVTQEDIKTLRNEQEKKFNKMRQEVPQIVNNSRKRGASV